MAPEEAEALVSETLAGYRINTLLESAGSTALYHATNTADGQNVVLKVLDPAAAREPGAVESFRADAARIASLRHPSLASVSRVGEDRGYHYAVQPLFLGSLRDQLERDGTPTTAEAVAIGARLAEVLATLHRQDIVYGDVRPEHVLLTHNGTPILSVFRVRHVRRDGSGERDVTYAAPEQKRGEEPDARSDIYALGAILYEMLTGTPPKSELDLSATNSAGAAQVVPPSRINPGVTPALDALVLRALAPDPADRYQDAKSLATALEDLSDVQDIDELATAKVPTTVVLPERPDVLTAETVKTVALPNWPLHVERPEPDEKRSRKVIALALLCVLLLGISSVLFFTLRGSASGTTGSVNGNPTSSFSTPTLPYPSDTATDPSSTSTSGKPTNTPHAGPTDTPIPGATATHTPKPGSTATPTHVPTATPTNSPPTATPTNPPPPASLSVSPDPIDSGLCAVPIPVDVTITNSGGTGMNWNAALIGGDATLSSWSGFVAANSSEDIFVSVDDPGILEFTANGANGSPDDVTITCA